MNKNFRLTALTAISISLFIANDIALASKLKTSSLAMVKPQHSGKVIQQCQKLFQEGEKLIIEASRQPGTHIQVKELRNKLSSSKKQILKMDSQMQQKSCDKGLIALNILKKKGYFQTK